MSPFHRSCPHLALVIVITCEIAFGRSATDLDRLSEKVDIDALRGHPEQGRAGVEAQAMSDDTSEPGLGRSQIVTPYDRVLSLFEDFRGAWRSEGRPSIAPYLDRAGGGLRATLLRN